MDANWNDTKKSLRKESKYDLIAELLDRDERQKMFDEHIEGLKKKNREMFRKMLDETPQVTLTCKWKDIKKVVKDDPRYSRFSSSDRVSCNSSSFIL